MMVLSAHVRVLVCVAAIDFRKGIDGLARVCREVLSTDPFSGTVFVFRNRRGTAIKLLAYDGQGFWLCQKRLSEGRFRHWPDGAGAAQRELLAHQLQVLLAGGDAEATRGAPLWRRLCPFGKAA
jgi:transposase